MLELIYNLKYPYLILCFVPTALIGLWLLSKKDCRDRYLPLIFMILSTAVWMLSNFLFYNCTSVFWLMFWGRVMYLSAGLIFPTLAHFVLDYPRSTKSWIKYWLYLPLLFIIPAIFSDLVVSSVNISLLKLSAGPLFRLFQVYVIFSACTAVSLLYSQSQKQSGLVRIQMKYLLWLILISTVAGIIVSSLLPFSALKLNVGYLGPVFSMIAIFGIYYIITRHAFLGIKIVLRKGLLLTGIIAIYTILYLIFILKLDISSKYLQAAMFTTAILSYAPLKTYLRNFLDKYFFKTMINYANELNILTQELLGIKKKDVLKKYLTNYIQKLYRPAELIIDFEKNNQSSFEIKLEPKGNVALGLKNDHELYSAEDKAFLNNIGKIISLSLTNIQHLESSRAAQEQLLRSEQLATLGQISAGVAHEIKNPLMGISLAMENVYDLSDNPQIKDISNAVIENIKELQHKLFLMMNIASEKDLNLTSVSPQELIRDVLFLINKQAKINNIKIYTNINTSQQRIKIDTVKIKQVILNLCLNSIEAMPDGGTLELDISSKRQALSITVKDSGQGIDKQIKPLLFQPFITNKEKGNGLGLAMTEKIIKAHKGAIKCFSDKEQGTRFVVQIPQED